MKPSGWSLFRKPGVLFKGFYAGMFCIFLTVFFSGCSGNALEFLADDDSKEAKMEDAMMALNDENFDKAASILEDMDGNDPEVKRYLSNAYSGQAGLDTFSLIETIEEINNSNTEGSVDLVGKILDDDNNGTFTETEINEKASKFDQAIETMLGIPSDTGSKSTKMVQALSFSLSDLNTKLDDPDLKEDIRVQLGLLGLSHAVLSIAKIVLNDLEGSEITEITLTEEWIKSQYENYDDFSIELTAEQQGLIDDITLDLNLLSASISALIEVVGDKDGNDLEEAFENFLHEIDANGDLVLTSAELEHYLKNL